MEMRTDHSGRNCYENDDNRILNNPVHHSQSNSFLIEGSHNPKRQKNACRKLHQNGVNR